MQQIGLRADDADLATRDLDALGQCPEVVAAVAAAGYPYPLASGRSELPYHSHRDGLLPGAFEDGSRSLGFGLRLVADRFEAADAVLERRVVQIGDAAFDGVIKTLEPQIGFRGPAVQLGDMIAAAVGAFLAAIEHRCQHFLKPFRLKQSVFNMAGNQVVQLLHRDRAAFAAGLALTRFDRACVVAVAPALAGRERHGAAAVGTEADAGKESRAADDARRRYLRIAGAEMRLHSAESGLVDQRRHLGGHDLAGRLPPVLGTAPVELMAADIGRPRQHFMELPNTPTSAVAGEGAARVQVTHDRFHAHRARCAVTLQRQAIDQPHCVGVQRIDFEPLLDFRAALLGRDDAIADRRARAVPEALPGIFLHGPERVLAVLLGLVLVKQRHHLAHHDMHRVVADFLGDRDELDAVLRELADVELELEVVAEEAAERMDEHDVKRGGLAAAGFDHPLELGPAVVRGRRAWPDVGLDQLVAARRAIGFALPLLVWYRDIVLGLPCHRHAQIEGGAQGRGHGKAPLRSLAGPEHLVEEIAEPRLEYVRLGLRDPHPLGPIVRDGPGREIMLRRPAEAGPRLRRDVKIVGQDAQADAWTGHPASIAQPRFHMNDRSLSRNILLPPGKSVMKGALCAHFEP